MPELDGLPESPCRLFVYLARDAPVAVVLRRGPSDWARLTLWHTDRDEFEHGQWLHARVYERRSDLSPDGTLFVAFVRDSTDLTAKTDSWATISRPPFFTALALWWIGGTYYTGGFFPASDRLWLGWDSNQPDQGQLPKWLKMISDLPPHIDRTTNWPSRTVWMNRLLRDGWRQVIEAEPETWERPQPGGELVLTMIIRSALELRKYGGRFVIEYQVRFDSGDLIEDLGVASWADWDLHSRLVIARDGKLFAWDRATGPIELEDFNPQRPEPVAPPDWAKLWPKRRRK